MRTAALTLAFFVAFNAAKAQQFTLLPHAGVEASKTKISYNNAASFSPLGVVSAPSAGMRLSYVCRQGHGFFLGAATSRSTVLYNFTDPEKGLNSYTASAGNMQVRMEGGYQFSSKPIYFSKSKQAPAKTATAQMSEKKKTCSKTYSTSTCSKSSMKAKQAVQNSNKGAWMKIQPSAGIGFIPAAANDVVTKTQNGGPVYEYRAGNWNTALITGAAFEFGKNNTRLFTVSINYFKGIGNLNTQTLITESSLKTVTTNLQSASSGWNMRIGIPFTLCTKKSTAQSATQSAEQRKSRCGQYKLLYQCRRPM